MHRTPSTMVLVGLLFLNSWNFAPAADVTYRVDFQGTWSVATHPGAFPGSAHFSPLVGGVHNDEVSFWQPGGFASTGIENVAELGSTNALRGEVQAAVNAGDAKSVLLGSSLFGLPNSTSLTFTTYCPVVGISMSASTKATTRKRCVGFSDAGTISPTSNPEDKKKSSGKRIRDSKHDDGSSNELIRGSTAFVDC